VRSLIWTRICLRGCSNASLQLRDVNSNGCRSPASNL
jgi:hypothetical protein